MFLMVSDILGITEVRFVVNECLVLEIRTYRILIILRHAGVSCRLGALEHVEL